MEKRLCFILIFAALALLPSCKNGGQQREAQTEETQSAPADTLLKMPEIPITMTDNGERAAFLVQHFWDNLDFTDTLRSLNRGFMEQNFANYLSIFPIVQDEEALGNGVERALKAAASEPKAHKLFADIAYKYLYEPNSPMASDDYYKLFLNVLIADPSTDSAIRERYQFQMECINKNLPGSLAANFSYVDRDGRRGMLLTTDAPRYLLLMFYDPDCEHCKATITHMLDDLHVNSFIESGDLVLLAVDAEGDRELWNSTNMSMPQEWRVAYDLSGIRDRNTYVLRALPSLYLLDSSKHIVLKDAKPEAVINKVGSSK
jgi:hypothetical protein